MFPDLTSCPRLYLLGLPKVTAEPCHVHLDPALRKVSSKCIEQPPGLSGMPKLTPALVVKSSIETLDDVSLVNWGNMSFI